MPTPTKEHIEMLMSDKSLAPMFDEVYGEGSSGRILAKDMSAGDVALKAVENIIPSAGKMAKDIGTAVIHPIDTAMSVIDLGAGVLQSMLPESIVQAIGEDKRSRDIAKAVGQHYINRYGSKEGIKDAIANDPVGVVGDLSAILTGGAGAVKGIAGLGKMSASTAGVASKVGDVADIAYKAGRAIDPASMLVKGASSVATKLDSKGIVPSIIGMKTGTGPQAVSSARAAGLAGGESGKAFLSAMSGDSADVAKVLDDVEYGVEQLVKQKNQEYASKWSKISNDKAVISMQPILDAVDNAMNATTYKGKLNKTLFADIKPVADEIMDWYKSDPAEFHTPAGLDELKKRVWESSMSKGLTNKTSEKLLGSIYHTIKNQITKEAPDYASIMKNYSDATEQIADIKKTLSLSKNASTDTQMRKLLSTMRSDVNTNFQQRFNIAEELQKASGRPIIPRLAGSAMSSWVPQGLMRAEVPLEALGAYAASGGSPAAAALSAASASPKLAGYSAYGAGATQRMLQNAVGKTAGAVGGAAGSMIQKMPEGVGGAISKVADPLKWATKGLYDEGLLPLMMYQAQQINNQGQ